MQLKFKLTVLFLFSLVIFNNFPAQKSLNSNLSNEDIEKKIDDNIGNPGELWKLINFYILKSKKEQNNEALFYAYRYASVHAIYPLNIR